MPPILRCTLAGLLGLFVLSACVVYEPVPYPGTTATPASFDRSWNAALGAAQDVGVPATSADRNTGRIHGRRNGAEIDILITPQADGKVVVKFDASGEPGLNERLVAAYNRRMGR